MKVKSWLSCFIVMLVSGTLNLPLCQADEQFGGTYHIPAGAGPALDLTLQQDAEGNATGTLSNGQVTFQVAGKMLQEGEKKGKLIAGTLRSEQASMYFAAEKHPDGRLEFVFIQPNAEGKADLTKTNTVIFPATNGGAGAADGVAQDGNEGGNNNASPANAAGNAPDENGGGAYSGTYTSNGNKGAVTLSLQQDADGTVTGTLGNAGANFRLKGKVMTEGAAQGQVAGAAYEGEKFASFFQIAKQAGQVVLSLISANAAGEPDMAHKVQIVFTANGGAATAGRGNVGAPGTAPNGGGNPGANLGGGAFAGTFKSADMTLESRNAGGQYVGTITFNGQTFKFSGQPKGNGLEGNFENKDDKFPFTASLNGNTMTFVTAGTTYQLVKQNPKPSNNPLAKPQSANPLSKPQTHNPLVKPAGTTPTSSPKPTTPANAAVHTASWKTYKHPVGLMMRYPADWTLQETQGMLQLVPPNPASSAAGATELYIVSGSPVGDITSAQDPRFIQAIEMIVGKLFPFLQRTGGVEQVRAGNEPGVALKWEGQNPTGLAVRAQVFATVLKGFGISVLAVGDKARIAARENVTRGIFTSFGAFEGEKDPQVVGTWKSGVADNGMLIKDAAGRVSTTSASDSSDRYTISPDGTISKVSHSRTIVNAPGVSLDTGDSYETTKGTWAAGSGKFVVFWENGKSNEWTYQVTAEPGRSRRLVLRAGQGGMVLGEVGG